MLARELAVAVALAPANQSINFMKAHPDSDQRSARLISNETKPEQNKVKCSSRTETTGAAIELQ